MNTFTHRLYMHIEQFKIINISKNNYRAQFIHSLKKIFNTKKLVFVLNF